MASFSDRLQRWRVYILGGLIPATLGLLTIGLGFYQFIDRQHFLAHAVHAQGTVVGNVKNMVSRKNSASSAHYTPIFEFEDAAGKRWKVTDQSTDYTLKPTPFGQSLPVLYNPDNPAEAQQELPDTLWNKLGPGPLFAGFGAFLAGVGLWCMRRYPLRSTPPLPGRDPAILAGP